MKKWFLLSGWLTIAALGCAFDIEMETTPDPVVLGEDVDFTITARNTSQCELTQVSFNVVPLLDPAGKAELEASLFSELGEEIDITLDDLCQFVETGQIPDLELPPDMDLATLGRVAQAVAGLPIAAVGATCTEMTPPMGPTFLECEAANLAPGDEAVAMFSRTAEAPGVLFSFAIGRVAPSGVCRDGDNAGDPCRLDQDCPSGSCGNGFCGPGSDAGNGCDEDTDCDGDCVLCDACGQGQGICTGTLEPGSACTTSDDCQEGECLCGVPIACDETEVITPTPSSTPTDTPTETPTATPTSTPAAPGSACDDDIQCVTGFCEQRVCCDRECGSGLEACNLPGSEGMCSPITAPAPVTSATILLLGLSALGMIGGVGIARRRRVRRR